MIDSTNFFVLEDFESHIQKTYTYNFPIEEVFKAFTDKDILSKIYPYQFLSHNLLGETFCEEEGNELSIIINSKERVIFKIIKWDSMKEVTIFNGQINIAKTTNQLKLISELKQKNIFKLEEIEEYLKNNVKNLEQDESILVNVSIDKFWNFCTQLNNIQLFINMPNSEIINEGNNILKLVDKSSNNYIRLIKREKKVEDSNYIMYLESFDSLQAMPLQSMQIQLIKVNIETTLIIYKHIMLDYIPINALRSNSGNKQKILKKIKKLLESKEKGKE